MTTTPPPMPDPVGHVYPFGSAWVSKEWAYTKAQMQARDAQWMERITSLEADRKMLREALENLSDAIEKFTNVSTGDWPELAAARAALEGTK